MEQQQKILQQKKNIEKAFIFEAVSDLETNRPNILSIEADNPDSPSGIQKIENKNNEQKISDSTYNLMKKL